VLATAVLRLFPEAKLDIGPPTDTGFYYDIDLDHKLTAEDLAKIEAEMKKVATRTSRSPARRSRARRPSRSSRKSARSATSSAASPTSPRARRSRSTRTASSSDLCAGTHVRYTKLKGVQAALHRRRLPPRRREEQAAPAHLRHRLPTKDELAAYLDQLEQAKLRDHRKLGKDLKLFVIDEDVGQGLILWTPNGSIIRQELQNFISEELRKQGYSQVFTPHIGKLELYKTSGHFPYYKDVAVPAVVEPESSPRSLRGLLLRRDDRRLEAVSAHLAAQINARTGKETITPDRVLPDDQLIDGFLLKPMNCPHHIKIFASQPHSYRDLPVRLAEFGTVYRWEQSGELNGMTRVRGFTQDDAHLFCTEEQVPQEILGCLSLVKIVLTTLGMSRLPRARRPARSRLQQIHRRRRQLGQGRGRLPRGRQDARRALHRGARRGRVLRPEDRLRHQGRHRPRVAARHRAGGLQPAVRFDLSYIGADNQPHRPVMIHRAPFGSMERFCGVLIEHFGGDFPLWLAPEQVRLVPISDKVIDYARATARPAQGRRPPRLARRAQRQARRQDPPRRDREGALHARARRQGGRGESVSVRSRARGDEGVLPFDQFLPRIQEEIRLRSLSGKEDPGLGAGRLSRPPPRRARRCGCGSLPPAAP
jgi:threonyl-tRNA synthetase